MTIDDSITPSRDADEGPSFLKWLKRGMIGVLAILVLGYGAIFLSTNVFNDGPDEADKSDLDVNRAVPIAFAAQRKRELNAKFHIETSSYEDINSVNQLFDQVNKIIANEGYYKRD